MRIRDWSSDVCSSDLKGMQDAMHGQVSGVIQQQLALLGRFAVQYRHAQDDVSAGGAVGVGAVLEGEHIGGIVLAAKFAVKALALAGVDQTQGQDNGAKGFGIRAAGLCNASQGVPDPSTTE